jgi:hypothetical protein
MHVTYPGAESKRQFKYYVCNNRLNHRSCRQDYIRADILEASIIQEIAKLAERGRLRLRRDLPEPEGSPSWTRATARSRRNNIGEEKLSQWLWHRATAQAVAFVNASRSASAETRSRSSGRGTMNEFRKGATARPS